MELLLKTIRNTIPVTEEESELIRSLFIRKELEKGAHILSEGSVCRHLTFIDSGLVRYYLSKDGEERTNYFNKEGEFVCDYQSFLPQQPSYVNIQALENIVINQVSFDNLQHFYKKVQYGNQFGRVAIEQVFVSVLQQVASLYSDPPDVRYQQFLQHFPDLTQRIPQYYIASYVGIQPQSLSRIRKRLATGH